MVAEQYKRSLSANLSPQTPFLSVFYVCAVFSRFTIDCIFTHTSMSVARIDTNNVIDNSTVPKSSIDKYSFSTNPTL